jgi:hypothetical protein
LSLERPFVITYLPSFLTFFFRKKAGLQDYIKKFITLEPLEINNLFLLYSISKDLADILRP